MLVVWFLSIGFHELAHALMARRFGCETKSVVFHMFGGVASIYSFDSLEPKKQMAVSFAGPVGSFVLSAIAATPYLIMGEGTPAILEMTMVFNFFAGAANLLPTLPLDGGRILKSALSMAYDGDAVRTGMRVVSMITCSTIFVLGALYSPMVAVLAVGLATIAYIETQKTNE